MNLKRHHVLYILLSVSLIFALLFFLLPHSEKMSFKTANSSLISSSTPTSATSSIQFEIVTTEAAQERGLGGRSDIPENYGMLFVFSKEEKVGFWMKDMLVPIDIIWLSDNGTILGVEDTLSPLTYPNIYYAPKPVRFVLEMRAGEMRRQGWSIGTQVPLPSPYSLHTSP